MNRSTKNIIGVLIIVIGLAMMFKIGFEDNSRFNVGGETSVETGSSIIKKNMSGIENVYINGTSEEISLTTHDGGDIIVEMIAEKSSGKKSKVELQVTKKNDEILITVDYPKLEWFTNNNVKLDIQLPKNYKDQLSIDLTSGNLKMKDAIVLKNLVVEITSGNVTFDDITSDKTRIDATSGKVNLIGNIGDLKGDMTSGTINIEYESFNSDIDFEMTSGNLDIVLDKNAEFNLDADLTSGNLDCEFDLEDRVEKDNDLKGSVGNSSNNIKIHMTSGNTDIKKK